MIGFLGSLEPLLDYRLATSILRLGEKLPKWTLKKQSSRDSMTQAKSDGSVSITSFYTKVLYR